VAASQATDEVLHFMKLEKDLGIEQDCIPMLLKQDNQATARSLVRQCWSCLVKTVRNHCEDVSKSTSC
jgi:hypothetical protein